MSEQKNVVCVRCHRYFSSTGNPLCPDCRHRDDGNAHPSSPPPRTSVNRVTPNANPRDQR
jgi:hypothetical protein